MKEQEKNFAGDDTSIEIDGSFFSVSSYKTTLHIQVIYRHHNTQGSTKKAHTSLLHRKSEILL
jgi:hypothetical protein